MLLKWLDEGGLSLYLLAHLRTFGTETKLSHSLQDELSDRLHANQIRTQALLKEFARVNSILQASGASFTFMKGFTLTPDFCSSIYLRHQTDIDVHISPLFGRQSETRAHSVGIRSRAGASERRTQICELP